MYLHFRWLGERPEKAVSEKNLWRYEHLRAAAERLGLLEDQSAGSPAQAKERLLAIEKHPVREGLRRPTGGNQHHGLALSENPPEAGSSWGSLGERDGWAVDRVKELR